MELVQVPAVPNHHFVQVPGDDSRSLAVAGWFEIGNEMSRNTARVMASTVVNDTTVEVILIFAH